MGVQGTRRSERRPARTILQSTDQPASCRPAGRGHSWNAFPRQVKSPSISDKQRWRRADADRNLQDEYCEWSVTRDPVTHKITRVTFTSEGPEYWETLAGLIRIKSRTVSEVRFALQ